MFLFPWQILNFLSENLFLGETCSVNKTWHSSCSHPQKMTLPFYSKLFLLFPHVCIFHAQCTLQSVCLSAIPITSWALS